MMDAKTSHAPNQPHKPQALIDSFGRTVDYIRLSVTDRCDFRCVYCMSEHMTFLPKADVLTLEELARLSRAFMRRGVKRIRLTGGEPLVRRDIMWLIETLGQDVTSGRLDELTLTTNGSQLTRFALPLARAGIRRINVSLDTLDPEQFARVTRWGKLDTVIAGIDAALAAGLQVKINTVALRHVNVDVYDQLIAWCGARGCDLTLIETMPLGDISESRVDQYVSLTHVKADLAQRWTLHDTPHQTGGPARYVRVAETGQLLGFITPLSHNFCDSCRRVRITCTGSLVLCLGQEDAVDLRAALRASPTDDALDAALTLAMQRKPKSHDFVISTPAVRRHMSVTGG